MISLSPISDTLTTGWSHTGGGGFYADVDESPDSPDAEFVHRTAVGAESAAIVFGLSTAGAAGITSALLRFRGSASVAGAEVLGRISDTAINTVKFQAAGYVAVSGSGVLELVLVPLVATPYTFPGDILLEMLVALEALAVLQIDAVEVILYQGDEPGGGGGPGPGGQVSRNAAFFSQMCGIP